MKNSYKIILGLILLLGLLIRVIGITDPGTGFYVDEASLGYNAKSILETGRDEYGQSFPLVFRSFGDYKPPLFVYTSIPLVSWLGEVAGVRLTSAILGVMTIWLVAEVARKLFGDREGLLAGVVIATLPWHVNLSRHGIEAVLATAMLSAALLLLVDKRYRSGLLMLAFSTLAYHSTRYISPLLALIVLTNLWLNKKGLKRGRVAWGLVGIVWVGVLMINLQPFANIRALGVQQAFLARNLIAAYVSYFSPRMLILGDWQVRNNIYGVSNMWLGVILAFYVGIWRVTRLKKNRNDLGIWLLGAILILSPIPASAAIDPFHAIRSLTMVVPISILAGIGGVWLIDQIKRKYLKVILVGLGGWLIFQTLLLSERLLVQNKLTAYDGWIGGYQQLVEKILELDTSGYTKIVIDTTDEPAIYSLWQVFGKVDTKQKIPLPHQTGYYQPVSWTGPESLILGNGQRVFFKPVYWPEDQRIANTLYIGSKWRFDPDAVERAGAEVLVEVRDLTGELVWMAVATKN